MSLLKINVDRDLRRYAHVSTAINVEPVVPRIEGATGCDHCQISLSIPEADATTGIFVAMSARQVN